MSNTPFRVSRAFAVIFGPFSTSFLDISCFQMYQEGQFENYRAPGATETAWARTLATDVTVRDT
jgi:hypothetical protein